MITIPKIGVIRSRFTEKTDPFRMKREESVLVVDEQYAEGLLGIEKRRYLQVIFHFHMSDSYSLHNQWYYGGERGVFACRTPNRPSTIGTSTVELLNREGNRLTVRGLDALDGTPLIDIKPWTDGQDSVIDPNYTDPFFLLNPRSNVIRNLKSGDLEQLLTEAGRLHGHYCPGLSYGVLAVYYGLRDLAEMTGESLDSFQRNGGLEELLAIIEVNSCFADGVQFVGGMTLGNNGLIVKDLGKAAVTFIRRGDKGIRLILRPEVRQITAQLVPGYRKLFDRVIVQHDRSEKLMKAFREASTKASFALMSYGADELFTRKKVEVDLPSYAPIRESKTCHSCGESVMGGDMSSTDETLCRVCAHEEYMMIDGSGFHKENIG